MSSLFIGFIRHSARLFPTGNHPKTLGTATRGHRSCARPCHRQTSPSPAIVRHRSREALTTGCCCPHSKVAPAALGNSSPPSDPAERIATPPRQTTDIPHPAPVDRRPDIPRSLPLPESPNSGRDPGNRPIAWPQDCRPGSSLIAPGPSRPTPPSKLAVALTAPTRPPWA